MDPSAIKHLSRERIYPRDVNLSPFQAVESHPLPGVYGAARFYPTVYVPMQEYKYVLTKTDSGPPKSATDVQDVVSVTPPKEDYLKTQIGFGNGQEEIDSDGDIDLKSLEKVPQNVLKAFENPSMTVSSASYKPKEKKIINSQSGQGKSFIKKTKTIKSKIKFV